MSTNDTAPPPSSDAALDGGCSARNDGHERDDGDDPLAIGTCERCGAPVYFLSFCSCHPERT